jgi:hypothetical protein
LEVEVDATAGDIAATRDVVVELTAGTAANEGELAAAVAFAAAAGATS